MIEAGGNIRVGEFVELYGRVALWDINSPVVSHGQPHMGHVVDWYGSSFCVFTHSLGWPHVGVSHRRSQGGVEIIDAWLKTTTENGAVDQHVLVTASKFRSALPKAVLYHQVAKSLPPEEARFKFNFLSSAVRFVLDHTDWPPQRPKPAPTRR